MTTDAQLENRVTMARAVAFVAAVFVSVVALILILNYVQLRGHEPQNSPALTALYARFATTPGDRQLAQEIRSLDLLARQALLTQQWQLRTGGFLLLGGAALFLAAFKAQRAWTRGLPIPSKCPGSDNQWEMNRRARTWLAVGGGLLLLLGLIAGFSTPDPLATVAPPLAQTPGLTTTPPSPVATTMGHSATSDAPGVDAAAQAHCSARVEILKNWPNFRGPDGNSLTTLPDLPTVWDGKAGTGVLWKQPVPKTGFSSPVVWGNRLFLTGADAQTREVYCFDADNGHLLWTGLCEDNKDAAATLPEVSKDTGFAAATPATDGRRVFAIFATAGVVAFDFDGNRLWQRNLGQPKNNYGHASSLITYGNLLIVQFDQAEGARVLAMDTVTGKTTWETPRTVDASWASPLIVSSEKRDELILAASPRLIAYAPDSGKELWRAECLGGEVAPSPAFAGGLVFAAQQYAKVAAVRISDAKILWENTDVELPDVASPVAVGELLFLAASNGTITCMDAKSGALLWKHEFDTGFYASPVVAGDRLYALDRAGVMHVIKADNTFVLLSTAALGEETVASPACAANRLYLRGIKNLYCIGR